MPSSRFSPGLAFGLLLPVAWVGVWLLERALAPVGAAQAAYFLGMKILVWVAPALVLVRRAGATLHPERLGASLAWGLTVGLLLAAGTLLVKRLAGRPLFSTQPSWALVNMVVVAPITEEIAHRGAVLPALTERVRPWLANGITALLFTLAHCPGWAFRGTLRASLAAPIGGALSVFLLGALFGWVAQRSRSIVASTLVHALGNLAYS